MVFAIICRLSLGSVTLDVAMGTGTLWVPAAASDCAAGSQGARDGGTGTALA